MFCTSIFQGVCSASDNIDGILYTMEKLQNDSESTMEKLQKKLHFSHRYTVEKLHISATIGLG